MRHDFLRSLLLASVMSVLGAFAEEASVDLESYAHEMRITVSGYSGAEKLNAFPHLRTLPRERSAAGSHPPRPLMPASAAVGYKDYGPVVLGRQ